MSSGFPVLVTRSCVTFTSSLKACIRVGTTFCHIQRTFCYEHMCVCSESVCVCSECVCVCPESVCVCSESVCSESTSLTILSCQLENSVLVYQHLDISLTIKVNSRTVNFQYVKSHVSCFSCIIRKNLNKFLTLCCFYCSLHDFSCTLRYWFYLCCKLHGSKY